GRREVLGMAVGPSEPATPERSASNALPFGKLRSGELSKGWTGFLRRLARRGLRGVELVVSGAHEGIKAAVAKLMNASRQRCRVDFMRNALAHEGQERAARRLGFHCHHFRSKHDAETAKAQCRKVAGRLRAKLQKLAALMDEAETDILASRAKRIKWLGCAESCRRDDFPE
ncbi:MAG: transposase, partial [Methylocella sp.]